MAGAGDGHDVGDKLLLLGALMLGRRPRRLLLLLRLLLLRNVPLPLLVLLPVRLLLLLLMMHLRLRRQQPVAALAMGCRSLHWRQRRRLDGRPASSCCC